MIKAVFLGLFLASGLALHAQVPALPDTAKLIEHLQRDNLAAAVDLARISNLSAPSPQMQKAEKLLGDANRRSVNDPARLELKGDIARLLGSDETAIGFYQNALDRIEEHFEKYGQRTGGRRNSDFYKAAYKAAICAFWLKDYERSFALLGQIEKNGDTWVSDLGRDKGKLLREFIAAPQSVSLNIKFAKAFWVANNPAVGLQFGDVLRFAEETLKLKPTREETKEIYVLVKNTALESGDIDTGERYMGKMIAEFAGDGWVTESAFSISQFYFSQKRYPDALRWLTWISSNSGVRGPTPLVYLGFAETYEKLGDEPAMVRYLKLAAGDEKVVLTARGIMDRSDTRQAALVRLGKYYKAKGDLEEALKYFTAWKPSGHGCGNCMAQFRYEKDLYIAQCLMGLGREDEALEKYLMPHLLIDGGELYSDAEIPRLVVSIYEKRNALEEFLELIKPHAASTYNGAAKMAEKLAQVKVLAKKGEIQRLVSEIRHTGGYVPNITEGFIRESNWLSVSIAEELAKLDGREFPFLKRRYDQLEMSKQDSAFADRLWVIYALGASRTKESEAFLQQLLQKAKAENASDALDDIVFALSMKAVK